MISKDGYSIIRAIFKRSEVAEIVRDMETLPLKRTRAGARQLLKHSQIAALAQDDRLLNIVGGLLGSKPLPFRATLFEKSPAANWMVSWHQDTALPVQERRDLPGWGRWTLKDGVAYAHAPAEVLEQVLAVRVHLDDATEENGCLRVLPATHTLGVLTTKTIQRLAAQVVAVNCVVPAGGVLIMRPLLVHASSSVRTTGCRRVLHIEYVQSKSAPDGMELAVN